MAEEPQADGTADWHRPALISYLNMLTHYEELLYLGDDQTDEARSTAAIPKSPLATV